VLALFRLITQRGGVVRIDGLDINTITLRSLRSALSVIPQDPLLFHSSIRTNLDPYGTVNDQRLWDVLESVQLGVVVSALPGGLDFVVSDAGENFSLGQRQLSQETHVHTLEFIARSIRN
jgi:ABC-type multidrug transport system fused ATPase/permease subunit